MKQSIFSFIMFLLALQVSAQVRRDSCCLAKKDLIGVWQRDIKGVGNGVGQNFRFFADGSFFLALANEGEDARGIVSLQGKYRLTKNMLYLMIQAHSVVEGGRIVLLDQGENSSIFAIEGGAMKLIYEHSPRESPDPLYILFTEDGGIKLGSETYYKLSTEDLKMAGIDIGSQK